MKTNVSIELTDAQRNKIAKHLDGKDTKRLITRAEVVCIATDAVLALLAGAAQPMRTTRVETTAPAELPPPSVATPRAVVEPSPDIPCENPLKEKDFAQLLADFYQRAKQDDPTLHTHIVWECERHGVKVK